MVRREKGVGSRREYGGYGRRVRQIIGSGKEISPERKEGEEEERTEGERKVLPWIITT